MPEHQDIEALAREAGVECIEAFRDEVRNSKGANRIAAIKALLAQGSKVGKLPGKGSRFPGQEAAEHPEREAAGASPAILQALEALRATDCKDAPNATETGKEHHGKARP